MLADPTSPDAIRHEVNVVPLNFRKDHIPDPKNPGELKEVEMVDLIKKGSDHGDSTPWKISVLKADPILWPAIDPYYQHWLKGQDEPVDGTSIDALAFVSPGMSKRLKDLHIRSAEDLAKINESAIQAIGMGGRMLKEKARLFVEGKQGDVKLAAALATRDAENAQLREEVSELKALVNRIAPGGQVQTASVSESPPQKRKPGRPRKNP